jgi:DNA-binding phage protein
VGRRIPAAIETFYGGKPKWLARVDPSSPEGVAMLLDDLRGKTPLVNVARAAERSRFSVARWLSAASEPRLPDFLRALEATSLRMLDFVACFADPATLPSAARAWRELQAARRSARELPWSHAVLRVIETNGYRKLREHAPGFIAERLGITLEEERRCLDLLESTGQILRRRKRFLIGRVLTVDTRDSRDQLRATRAWWANLAVERMRSGAEGSFSYNLFSVSRADYQRIEALHRAHFREIRSLVAASAPMECVGLMSMALLPFGPAD